MRQNYNSILWDAFSYRLATSNTIREIRKSVADFKSKLRFTAAKEMFAGLTQFGAMALLRFNLMPPTPHVGTPFSNYLPWMLGVSTLLAFVFTTSIVVGNSIRRQHLTDYGEWYTSKWEEAKDLGLGFESYMQQHAEAERELTNKFQNPTKYDSWLMLYVLQPTAFGFSWGIVSLLIAYPQIQQAWHYFQ